jgi:hypothetical protein
VDSLSESPHVEEAAETAREDFFEEGRDALVWVFVFMMEVRESAEDIEGGGV